MKNRENIPEVLGNWEDRQFDDWYAVDVLKPNGEGLRIMVTNDAEDAKRLAADRAAGRGLVDPCGEPCEPGEFGPASYYRCTMIGAEDAREYLLYVATDFVPKEGRDDAMADLCLRGDCSGFESIPKERPYRLPLDVYEVTASEAADVLGVSKQRVCALCAEGRLDARKTSSGWLVYRASLEELAGSERKAGRPRKR